MPALRDFVRRLGPLNESICSKCCQIVHSHGAESLEAAERSHVCGRFSLNTVRRGEFSLPVSGDRKSMNS